MNCDDCVPSTTLQQPQLSSAITTPAVKEQQPVSIQGIIFDLDGTLLDTETLSDYAMYAALNISPCDSELLVQNNDQPNNNNNNNNANDDEDNSNTKNNNKQYRQRLPWELKRRILGLRSAEWGPIVLQYAQEVWGLSKDTIPSNSEELATVWEGHLNEYCHTVQSCTGAYELVHQLSTTLSLPMAIATSSRQSAVNIKRQNHSDLFHHFPIIVCGDHPNVHHGKPAPDIYIEAARQMNVLPQHCLVFEDAMNGILSAKAAGCGYVVAIPDTRYYNDTITTTTTTTELEKFHHHADMVLPNLLHFNGTNMGINIDMSQLSSSPSSVLPNEHTL